ncbi:Uncharacterized membrane-anchored protein YjiN, DUF445 family [Paenibacillus sp. UNCCL117]|uniref:DUF445 domain-containing protein n=1 Tax=unclassified Paenibacillus TaxID=185978 RepID=UPI000891C7FC|nr:MULTISPECIES: DUF445 domain-containing protein [unclassified Paenibacillus]SDE14236.1 Uncharacterized membrane-anchored protein YjiN, DUF445 family [Paenibacillus sp. cl123]SFW60541.1 Uncharacterized membrane-anchored protein YjiN, DUF445 family [Paenibacillus sp. UNCCL117]
MRNKKGKAGYTAVISLIVMFAGFVLTIPWAAAIPWVRFLQSGFEAGLVGGLADWFAVTALFRHPLGIPIPHTALLPKNRERVTQALVSTVQNELLSKESMTAKLETLQIGERLLELLDRQVGTEQAKEALLKLVETVLEQIPWDEAAGLAEKELRRYADELDVPQLLQTGVRYAVDRQYDEKALNGLLDLVYDLVSRTDTRNRLGALAVNAVSQMNTGGGFMSFAMNAFAGFVNEDKLGGMIQEQLLREIIRLKNAQDGNRRWVLGELRQALQSFGQTEEQREAIESWKRELLDGLELSDKTARVVQSIRSRLTDFVRGERFAEEYMIPYLKRMLHKLKSDAAAMHSLETFIRTGLTHWIGENHHLIGKLIHENVDKFDNATLISLMEDKIGKDLQWIRVNGAICGFLIGLVLFGVRALI